MTYKEYIDLGFSRCEIDCGVTFNETGYGGFALTKNINEKMMVEAISEDLNSPKLYIRKGDGESYHIFTITPEAVKDLLNNNMPPVILSLQQDDSDMLFHECPNCNWRCNCTDQPCSCCNEV